MLRLMMVGVSVVTIAAAGGCSASLGPNSGTGGSPGTGGAPVNSDGSVCTLGMQGPQLWAHGLPPQGLTFDYDGPALVSQSTTDTLTLTINLPADAGITPDAGNGTTDVQITGMTPMPLFPIMARVWLTKSKDGMPWFGPPPPSSFAVRDGQGGPLLLGAAIGRYGSLSFPVQVDQLAVTCTERDEGCAPNGIISFAGAVVTGDQPVFVQPDQLGMILLGGVPYEVRLYAASEPVVQPVNCTDFFGIDEVQVDVRSTNLAGLIAGLPNNILLDGRQEPAAAERRLPCQLQ
jgi:hypothetical protein